MSTAALPQTLRNHRSAVTGIVVVVVVLVAMALCTKVVSGSVTATGAKKFSAAQFGKDQFPKVQQAIVKRAVPAATLAAAIKADQAAAAKKYAVTVEGAVGPEVSVSFTGVAGTSDSGVYPITIAGLPKSTVVRIQTGPAINGTDLRDATGTITFSQFTNQIDYQNAASALNQRLKTTVLTPLTRTSLTGKTVTVSGAFQLINPNGWLVTPATMKVT